MLFDEFIYTKTTFGGNLEISLWTSVPTLRQFYKTLGHLGWILTFIKLGRWSIQSTGDNMLILSMPTSSYMPCHHVLGYSFVITKLLWHQWQPYSTFSPFGIDGNNFSIFQFSPPLTLMTNASIWQLPLSTYLPSTCYIFSFLFTIRTLLPTYV